MQPTKTTPNPLGLVILGTSGALFSVIVGYSLNPRTVDGIDATAYPGATVDPILVSAHDDVGVTGAVASLMDAGGTELWSGPATVDEWRWRYGAQTDVPPGTAVTVTSGATDRPRHRGGVGGGDDAVGRPVIQPLLGFHDRAAPWKAFGEGAF